MLPQMACVVGTLRPGRCLIDVGANIGDTAALVRLAGAKQRIICVEASKRFFDLMTENVALYRSFYGEIELVRAFVGSPDTGVVLREARGSARLVQGAEADDIPIVGLADVARGRRVGLVKLDTDGFDWQIILQGIDWLRKELPVLWVEAEITSRPGLEGWCRALRELSRDYAYVFAFDNFGFPLASFPLNEPTQNALGQLFQYTWKSTNHRRTISYMDLCFVPARETELVDAFEARVNQVLVNSGYA
jgi:FkbM family methyltransferase